ncbi:MAG: glycosyltransferase family 2 protein [Opitutales bacterium]
MNHGRVCAIVSIYRASRWLDGCLDALARSTLNAKGGLEILCLDAASPENEAVILARWQERLPKLRYVRLKTRLGLYATWNHAARLTDCPYLAIASADDRFLPGGLERLVDGLEANPNAVGTYGDWIERDAAYLDDEDSGLPRRAGPFSRTRLLNHFFCGSQWMWRRSAQEAIGGFDESFRIAGDHDFLLRLTASGPMAYAGETVGVVGRHAQALSEGTDRLQAERERLLKRWLGPDTVAQAVGREVDPAQPNARIAHAAASALCATPPWRGGAPEPFLDAATCLTELLADDDPLRAQLETAQQALLDGADREVPLPLLEEPQGSGPTPFVRLSADGGWWLNPRKYSEAYLGEMAREQVDRCLSALPKDRLCFIRGAGVKGRILAHYLRFCGRTPAGFLDRGSAGDVSGIPRCSVSMLADIQPRPLVFVAMDARHHSAVLQEHLEGGLDASDVVPVAFEGLRSGLQSTATASSSTSNQPTEKAFCGQA